MKLGKLISELVMFLEDEVTITICNRDEDNVVIGKKNVPFHYIKTNFDTMGISIRLEQKDIDSIPWGNP